MENKRKGWILRIIVVLVAVIAVAGTGCGSSEKAQREASKQAKAAWEE